MQSQNTTNQQPRSIGKYVTAEVVSDYFGVSPDLIYLMARKARSPCHRLGRLVRFRLDEVEAALVVPASEADNG